VGECAVLVVEVWSVDLQAFLTFRTVSGQRGVYWPGQVIDTRDGPTGVFEWESEFVTELFYVVFSRRLFGEVADVELDGCTKWFYVGSGSVILHSITRRGCAAPAGRR
jgi:hypothetical protein